MFFLLCEGWIPSLNYLSWETLLPTEGHQRIHLPPVYNDRSGLTHRNLHYSPDEMLNKVARCHAMETEKN